MDMLKKVVEINIYSLLQQKKNRIMLENYTEVLDEIKEKIKLITGEKIFRYSKDFMRMKLKTSDNLPYNEMINIPVCVL